MPDIVVAEQVRVGELEVVAVLVRDIRLVDVVADDRGADQLHDRLEQLRAERVVVHDRPAVVERDLGQGTPFGGAVMRRVVVGEFIEVARRIGGGVQMEDRAPLLAKTVLERQRVFGADGGPLGVRPRRAADVEGIGIDREGAAEAVRSGSAPKVGVDAGLVRERLLRNQIQPVVGQT